MYVISKKIGQKRLKKTFFLSWRTKKNLSLAKNLNIFSFFIRKKS